MTIFNILKSSLPPKVQMFLRDRLGSSRDPEILILDLLSRMSDRVLIDIGANRGVWTYRLRRLVGENGILLAIEANPNCFNYLKKAFLGDSKVGCFNLAVTDQNMPVDIYANPNETELLHSGTTLKPLDSMVRLETVPGITLDSFIVSQEGIHGRKIGLIKIDTEGGEIEVIRGAKEILAQSQPVLIIEILHRNIESNLKNLQNQLKGYECYVFEEFKFVTFESWNRGKNVEYRSRSRNYIFLPQNQKFEFVR